MAEKLDGKRVARNIDLDRPPRARAGLRARPGRGHRRPQLRDTAGRRVRLRGAGAAAGRGALGPVLAADVLYEPRNVPVLRGATKRLQTNTNWNEFG